MFRNQSGPFPLDPSAPPHRIVHGRSDPFPIDPNAPQRRPDRAARLRHPRPAAGAEALRTADALEREPAQLHLIGPAAGAELRRSIHGDSEHDQAPTTPTSNPPIAPQPRPGRRWPLPALAAALLALVAGLLALASPASAAVTADRASVAHAAVRVPVLSWSDCGDGLQCTTASVPLDYDKPGGQQITLALARRPATDPAHRLGSLFVNNGGPGNSVIEFMRGDVTEVLSDEVQARFDVIGMDPRGVGDSTPVRCFDTAAEQQRFFAARVPFPTTAEETRDFTAGSIEIGRRCAQRNGKLLEHLSTANVARDIDLLRRAVGDDQLTYAGYSYGGLLGITYANLFPRNVRAMLLDGLPDPAAYSAKGAIARREPVTIRVDSATATERALGFFLDRCQAAGPGACAFAAHDTRAKFDELLRRLGEAPVTIETPDGPVTVTPAFVLDSMRGGLQFPPIWPGIAFQLQATFEATEQPPALAQPQSGLAAAEPYDNGRDAFLAVACADTVNPSDPEAWTDIASRAAARNPHFGADWAWQSQPCAAWPARDKDRYRGPYTRRTANPVLLVNATLDAASNYQQATVTAQRLPGSRLLTLEGSAHPASFVSNACLTAHITSYLVDKQLPNAGAVCQPDQHPFESTPPPTR
jgi:pimeloyl-ACP methyl ester carboxylesterase